MRKIKRKIEKIFLVIELIFRELRNTKLFKNKYLLASTCFALWVAFFDSTSLLGRFSSIRNINKLEVDRDFYKVKIHEDNRKLIELVTNKNNLEKFAREEYYMKKENEDVFVIVKEESKEEEDK